MDIPTLAHKWVIRLLKTVLFLLIIFVVGRSLGPAEKYINHEMASSICNFIYGDVNAEAMYETYTNIDVLTVLTFTTIIYLLTMKLFNKIKKS